MLLWFERSAHDTRENRPRHGRSAGQRDRLARPFGNVDRELVRGARHRRHSHASGPSQDESNHLSRRVTSLWRLMVLLTGATGNVGGALLRRLTASGERVRCLVRDPRRLGSQRVQVQIALGDLSDPASFRNALRGVDTVVHLAAAIRDQPRASIEALNGVAALRLVRAAERSNVERFVFFSAIGASQNERSRFFRAKALAERAVEESPLATTVFAPSIVYSPEDPWITLLARMSLLPAMPISGSGRARYQPIWSDDVAAC